MSLHAGPEPGAAAPRWKLLISSHYVPANNPLSQFKTANKLSQILARAEADIAGADEALLQNTDDFVVEGTASNLFWIKDNTICTPPLSAGILPGVTRSVVLEICQMLKVSLMETTIRAEDLKRVDGIFVSLTSRGVVEATSLDGKPMKSSPLFAKIHNKYCNLLVSS
jgi:branched-subunit amino acid aminotransferase/4-amino-4-deoxychorismate lyase